MVQSHSCVPLSGTPWTAARQAHLCFTNSQSLFKLMSIESVMPSNHLILCLPLLLLLPSIFPSILVPRQSQDHSVSWLLLPGLCTFLPSLISLTVWICPLGLRGGHGGWSIFPIRIWGNRTSLVVQWLRICLPMQGTWARSWVGELRSHILGGNQAWGTISKPVSHNYRSPCRSPWRVHAPQ